MAYVATSQIKFTNNNGEAQYAEEGEDVTNLMSQDQLDSLVANGSVEQVADKGSASTPSKSTASGASGASGSSAPSGTSGASTSSASTTDKSSSK